RMMMRRVRLEKTCSATNCEAASTMRRTNGSLPDAPAAVPMSCRSSTPAVTSGSSRPFQDRSDLLEAIAHTVQRFDHVEVVVDRLEFFAQPLDVAVDGAVVDVDLVVISRVHQGVPA